MPEEPTVGDTEHPGREAGQDLPRQVDFAEGVWPFGCPEENVRAAFDERDEPELRKGAQPAVRPHAAECRAVGHLVRHVERRAVELTRRQTASLCRDEWY